jgi:aspartate 1-decarboxylase
MMLRSFVTAKIHGISVTAASVEYHGSVTVGADLLDAAGIQPYERVFVVNLSTGARWDTYALPGHDGVFTLNGGSARLGVPGDRCVIMTYGLAERAPGAVVVFCDEANRVSELAAYPPGVAP